MKCIMQTNPQGLQEERDKPIIILENIFFISGTEATDKIN